MNREELNERLHSLHTQASILQEQITELSERRGKLLDETNELTIALREVDAQRQ